MKKKGKKSENSISLDERAITPPIEKVGSNDEKLNNMENGKNHSNNNKINQGLISNANLDSFPLSSFSSSSLSSFVSSTSSPLGGSDFNPKISLSKNIQLKAQKSDPIINNLDNKQNSEENNGKEKPTQKRRGRTR